jgi:hypothetical protein
VDSSNQLGAPENSSAKEAVRKYSFGEEFGKQQKQGQRVWLLILGGAFGALAYFLQAHFGLSPLFYAIPIVIGCIFLFMYQTLTAQASKCPSCRQDITTCSTIFCHVCGEKLNRGRCERCAVDQTWKVAVRPTHESFGNNEPITYCPQCGVSLRSNFRRFKGD